MDLKKFIVDEVVVCETDCLHKACDIERKKQHYQENREHLLKKQKEYRDNRTPEQIAKRKAYKAKHNIEYSKRPDVRNKHLVTKYGITLKIWEVMLKVQDNKCANILCGKTLLQKPHDTHTDHDHDTGSVRGLLCNGCNTLLGKVEKLLKFLIEDKIELPFDFDEIQKGLYAYLKDDYAEWNNSWGAKDYRNLHN